MIHMLGYALFASACSTARAYSNYNYLYSSVVNMQYASHTTIPISIQSIDFTNCVCNLRISLMKLMY